jgi:4-hydroxy-2-oxoheptanedioate aldolase
MATNGMKDGNPASQVSTLGMVAYRAPSLFQPHRAREALADAHAGRIPPLIGYFAGLSSTAITRVVASFGYDIIVVDWEHSTLNLETMTQVDASKMEYKY